jgi:putative proteasome-type protease
MTYCVAMVLDAGMIFASDSRTNAGVDQIAKFCKMRVFDRAGDRVIAVVNSGNLSITQNAVSLLENRAHATDGSLTMFNAMSMFDVATLLGECLREVKRRDGPYLTQGNVDAGAAFLIGGQIGSERPRLFHVYAEGNFIEATPETPYFQIGEIKYGKPIIDRVITRRTSLVDAAKCTLVSFDSTMRSNMSVGLPLDLLVYETGGLQVTTRWHIEESDPYFNMIHTQWGEGLRKVFTQLPDPSWPERSQLALDQGSGI